MLKIKEIRDTLRQIAIDANVPLHEIWVSAGGAMVAHGLRTETHDIDIGCSPHYFRVLAAYYGMTPVHQSGASNLPAVAVRVLPIPALNCDIYEEFITPAQCLVQKQGIWVYSLEFLLLQKRALGRPKDVKDINVLTRCLALLKTNPHLAVILNAND